jgi:hypothetical protein
LAGYELVCNKQDRRNGSGVLEGFHALKNGEPLELTKIWLAGKIAHLSKLARLSIMRQILTHNTADTLFSNLGRKDMCSSG